MIHARGLRYAYPNGVAALDGVDLSVAPGERVAIVGPNGAGKTTLMLQLNGLLRGSGELTVTGGIGLVFQDPDDQLFMPTVREDVAFGPLNLGLADVPGPRRGGAGSGPHARATPTARRISSAWARSAAWRSRPCWRWSRACSCSTSRARTSTRGRGAS